MLGASLGRAGAAALGAFAALAPAAHAALPSVSSGELPGPPALYASAPSAPQLAASGPFTAPPLLVSGTDAYRDGEYVYQDYLFDDRGADSIPLLGSRPENLDTQNFSPTAGDVQYPTGPEYLGNAADLVEFRVTPTPAAIVYRVTLNTVVDPDTAVVGIGIDTDGAGGAQAWPNGAGISSPGIDRFITAWGTGGEVRSLPGGSPTTLAASDVSIDSTTKQMTISVPRAILDPGTGVSAATWGYVAGTGLWNSSTSTWRTPAAGTSPGTDTPASGGPSATSAVFNLAFRFDEPQLKQPQLDPPSAPLPYTTAPGTGNWYEDKQALALANGTTAASTVGVPAAGGDDFEVSVDFGELEAETDQDLHAPGSTQARIFPSSLDEQQGVTTTFPEYRGQLQPYTLHVPPGYDPGIEAGLTFALHSLGGGYTQFSVFSPNQFVELGDQRNDLVVTPLAHGADGWYTDEGETDVFEVWADVNRHFNLDPERSYLSGYSMGGYGSYKLGVHYPDLWSRAFTTVGPPGEGVWVPPGAPSSGAETLTRDLLENVRWVPFMNWVGTVDELVPWVGPLAQQTRFNELGLRSSLLSFAGADHFALAILDQWDAGRDFLGEAARSGDPSRVDYAFFPAADRPALGLVHDHAYWVSDLLARDSAGAGARGEISARSLAFGEGDPITASSSAAGPPGEAGPPLAHLRSETQWTSIPAVPAENILEATLENIDEASIDGARARLDGSKALRVELATDGASTLDLDLALPAGATAVRTDSGAEQPAPEVALSTNGASIGLDSAGSRTYVIRPPASSTGPDSGGGSGGSGGASDAAKARCKGRTATIVGTAARDRLRGTPGDDVIVALAGNDRVRGRGGNDTICGNAGRDRLSGGGGSDSCFAGAGLDRNALSCESARSPRRRG